MHSDKKLNNNLNNNSNNKENEMNGNDNKKLDNNSKKFEFLSHQTIPDYRTQSVSVTLI